MQESNLAEVQLIREPVVYASEGLIGIAQVRLCNVATAGIRTSFQPYR